jgi:hypothetical protein
MAGDRADTYAARRWPGPKGYEISTDRARLDVDRIHSFLSGSYWSPGSPRDVVECAIAHSVPFGLYASSGEQVGLHARSPIVPPTPTWLTSTSR